MALELGVEEDAAQVGMAAEADAEHVPDLPLRPERALPERHRRRHLGVVARDGHLHPQPVAAGEGVQLIDHRKPRLLRVVVDRGHVAQTVEAQRRVVAQRPQALGAPLPRHDHDRLPARELRRQRRRPREERERARHDLLGAHERPLSPTRAPPCARRTRVRARARPRRSPSRRRRRARAGGRAPPTGREKPPPRRRR